MGIFETRRESLGQHWQAVLFAILAAVVLTKAISRLYFHPLANIPGPKLAAVTWLYEFYYDIIKGGQGVFQLKKLHERYGPIIRITPNEVHVNDPNLIDVVYPGGGKKVNKDPYFVGSFGVPESSLLTVEHDLHRTRRGALNRFFSKSSVRESEPFIQDAAQRFCLRLEENSGNGPVTLSAATSSFSTDVINEHNFGFRSNYLDGVNFKPNLQNALDGLSNSLQLMKQLPWLHVLMRMVPHSLFIRLNPDMADYFAHENRVRQRRDEVITRIKNEKLSEHHTIFDELLRGTLPEEEKRPERVFQEGLVAVSAASETTAWTLTVGLFHVLNQPEVLSKLRAELESNIPDASELPPLSVLEQLPYLSATVHEALRRSYGVASRLPRIQPDHSVYLHSHVTNPATGVEKEVDYAVPPGYAVSMSSVLVHTNPEIFPEPYTFQPERWLNGEGVRRKDLDRYLLSFSKGTRQCLGINLAYAELFICIATIVLRLGNRLKLYETTEEDVEIQRDCFGPRPKHGSKGVRVLVK
ncbi:oxoglutarate/iron-dependent oxygenase [Mytilinidion resinicola]|uniref:Oxoglutarate/iron-dependent oxygenase n=1 Tax=Mytilinidion resinicola TaxID=574789 RepID=A0A6A6YLJ2_9PEZI|nr:oxoglutarate/iron-dependent oxygenase [Mytilinidion resinicola]KAF2808737.1 oxoglutarate/iron-dependent oxygenase [Mytilinidion resinicola]